MSSWASGQLQNGGISDVVVAFGEWRVPSPVRPVWVLLQLSVRPSLLAAAAVELQVDRTGGTTPEDVKRLSAPASLEAALQSQLVAWLPAGASYQVANVADPMSVNAILEVNEVKV